MKRTPLARKTRLRAKTRSTPRPWRMCRSCHRAGTKTTMVTCDHRLLDIGECGQCGKRRPLVECHAYDFRAPRKPLPKVNARQAKERAERMRSWYKSAEYRRQRKESLELAGHRCQYIETVGYGGWGEGGLATYRPLRLRCQETTHLHMHELRYKFERSTPDDRIILCKAHHELVEQRDHPTRRHGRSA